jgi:hypothetical protein
MKKMTESLEDKTNRFSLIDEAADLTQEDYDDLLDLGRALLEQEENDRKDVEAADA